MLIRFNFTTEDHSRHHLHLCTVHAVSHIFCICNICRFTGYQMRCQLAAIDHNMHVDRPNKTNARGMEMLVQIIL